jgi:hypothetical protein
MIGRRDRQMGSRRQALSVHPALVCVLAVLVILQGFAAVCSSHAHSPRAGEGALALFSTGPNCVPDAQDDHHSPVHEHDEAQCCVLCGARDLDGTPLAAVALVVASLEPPPALWTGTRLVDAHMKPPAGWASSWSSRAPPFFS